MFYYAHRLLHKLGFYNYVNLFSRATIGGKKFRVPIINGTGYHHLLKHEEWFIHLLKKILPTVNGCFVDVGMNIGQTLLKLNAIDANIPYIGFEPNPLCYHYCRKLIEANGIHNYSLYPVGLFDKDQILTLFMDKDYASGASVLPHFRKQMEKYYIHLNVPLFVGDEILEKHNTKVGVLKADVEGAELEVVKGCLEIIKRDLPVLILEILPVYTTGDSNAIYRKKREEELLAVLFNLGYQMFLISETDASITPLHHIEVHGDMRKTNYLFIHNSNVAWAVQ